MLGVEDSATDTATSNANTNTSRKKQKTLNGVQNHEDALNEVNEQKHEHNMPSQGSSIIQSEAAKIADHKPFVDLCKRRFLWYYDSYLESIRREREQHGSKIKDLTAFQLAAFEGHGNRMAGTYIYSVLEKRLKGIYDVIAKETDKWAELGKTAMIGGTPLTELLQRDFKRIGAEYSKLAGLVALELVDGNCFVWQMTLFGRPVTSLEGAELKIRIGFSPKFPHEQPRVHLDRPPFHNRISPSGDLCYFPTKPDDIKSHIDAIVKAIEDDSPLYDPRTLVNREAATLLWGTAEQKKLYNRKLRRSVSDDA